MKRCVIYARYSSENQHETSIEAQVEACEKFAAQEGWIIINRYIDRAFSATNDNRPAFQEMIQDAKKQMFDYVLVHKLDRFSRDRYDKAYYKRELLKYEIQIVSVLERIDDSPEGVIMESLLDGLAEYYSKNIGREAMKGLIQRAKKGQHCGGIPPLGLDVDPETRLLVVNEEEAVIVREIFELYDKGYGYKAICSILNSKGYRTKAHVQRGGKGGPKIQTPFSPGSIYTILRNEKYIGTYVFNRSVSKYLAEDGKIRRNSNKSKPEEKIIKIENCFPAIIDKDLFYRVQAKLDARKHNHQAVAASCRAKEVYLVSGKIFCECGAKMFGRRNFAGRNKHKYLTYRCYDKNQKGPSVCKIKEIRKEYLEDWIVDVMFNQLFTEQNLQIFLKELNEQRKKKEGSYESTLEALKSNLRQVKSEIDNLLILAAKVVSESLADRLAELEQKKKYIQAEIKNLESKEPENVIDMDTFRNIVKNIKQYIVDDNMVLLKNVVQKFVDKVVVGEDTIEVIFTFSFLLYNKKTGYNEYEPLSLSENCICLGGGEATPRHIQQPTPWYIQSFKAFRSEIYLRECKYIKTDTITKEEADKVSTS